MKLLMIVALITGRCLFCASGASNLITELTEKNFEKEVLNSSEACLVFFFKSGCSGCEEFLMSFEDIAEYFVDHVRFGLVNADQQDVLSMILDNGNHSYPTTVLFEPGETSPTFFDDLEYKAIVAALKRSLQRKLKDRVLDNLSINLSAKKKKRTKREVFESAENVQGGVQGEAYQDDLNQYDDYEADGDKSIGDGKEYKYAVDYSDDLRNDGTNDGGTTNKEDYNERYENEERHSKEDDNERYEKEERHSKEDDNERYEKEERHSIEDDNRSDKEDEYTEDDYNNVEYYERDDEDEGDKEDEEYTEDDYNNVEYYESDDEDGQEEKTGKDGEDEKVKSLGKARITKREAPERDGEEYETSDKEVEKHRNNKMKAKNWKHFPRRPKRKAKKGGSEGRNSASERHSKSHDVREENSDRKAHKSADSQDKNEKKRKKPKANIEADESTRKLRKRQADKLKKKRVSDDSGDIFEVKKSVNPAKGEMEDGQEEADGDEVKEAKGSDDDEPDEGESTTDETTTTKKPKKKKGKSTTKTTTESGGSSTTEEIEEGLSTTEEIEEGLSTTKAPKETTPSEDESTTECEDK